MAYHEIDGALFKDAPSNDGKKHPLMHLALEVLGVRMNVAVWPAETAKTSGVKYWPCSGSYAKSETKRLVPVDVSSVRIKYTDTTAGTGGAASPAPVVNTNQPASVDNADTDLPF